MNSKTNTPIWWKPIIHEDAKEEEPLDALGRTFSKAHADQWDSKCHQKYRPDALISVFSNERITKDKQLSRYKRKATKSTGKKMPKPKTDLDDAAFWKDAHARHNRNYWMCECGFHWNSTVDADGKPTKVCGECTRER